MTDRLGMWMSDADSRVVAAARLGQLLGRAATPRFRVRSITSTARLRTAGMRGRIQLVAPAPDDM